MGRPEHRRDQRGPGVVHDRAEVPGATDLLVEAPIDERPPHHQAGQPQDEQAEQRQRWIHVERVLAGPIPHPCRHRLGRTPGQGVEDPGRAPHPAAALGHDQRGHGVAQHPDDEHHATRGGQHPEELRHAPPDHGGRAHSTERSGRRPGQGAWGLLAKSFAIWSNSVRALVELTVGSNRRARARRRVRRRGDEGDPWGDRQPVAVHRPGARRRGRGRAGLPSRGTGRARTGDRLGPPARHRDRGHLGRLGHRGRTPRRGPRHGSGRLALRRPYFQEGWRHPPPHPARRHRPAADADGPSPSCAPGNCRHRRCSPGWPAARSPSAPTSPP